MDFENFLTFIVVEYNVSPWPPSEPTVMFQHNEGDAAPGITLLVLPSGELTLRVEAAGRVETRVFQPLKLTMPTMVVIEISMRNAAPRLAFNGIELDYVSDAGGTLAAVEIPQHFARPTDNSITNPSAPTACAAGIALRREYFAKRQPFKEKLPHRSKSVAEQVDELKAAAAGIRRNLGDLRTNVRGDPSYVVSQLRALLYAPNLNSNWNPLLRRLANLESLPLPVYYTKEDEERHPAGALIYYDNNSISIEKRFPGQSLGDLDEFLTQPLITFSSGKSSSEASAADLIGKLASSASVGHYDETVAQILDDARAPGINHTNFLEMLVMDIGRVVADLSDYVVAVLHANSAQP